MAFEPGSEHIHIENRTKLIQLSQKLQVQHRPTAFETDGTIPADEAASLAAKILNDHLMLFVDLSEEIGNQDIMVDNNFSFIKVIDPRGRFGKYDIYGDPRYELAKIMHSIDGKYDYIIGDFFEVAYDLDSCIISYKIFDKEREYCAVVGDDP